MKLPEVHRTALLLFCVTVFLAPGCGDSGSHEGTLQRDAARTLASLHRVGDSPLYAMTYFGGYGFSEFLKTGTHASSQVPEEADVGLWGCTCFAATGNDATRLFGRNFDWHTCVPLLLFTRPPGGYASVSMVDLEYLGYNQANLPDAPGNAERLLEAPFWPFDGVNERGVAIGIMAVPTAKSPQKPGRVTIGEIDAVRLVLDYAGNVEEAITLMGSYTIRMEDPPIHYLIEDRSGHSAVVEFVAGEMVVLRNDSPWQVSTNFVISTSTAPDAAPCWRYNVVYAALQAAGGVTTPEGAMQLLQRSSQSSTQWSTVYKLDLCELEVVLGRDYATVHRFSLNAE